MQTQNSASFHDIYDSIIIGGGVVGAAELFVETFTNTERVLLLEKHQHLAALNSNQTQNSQTKHRGDIESNMGIDQALRVKDASTLIVNFLERYNVDRVCEGVRKMLLAVGLKEVQELSLRYQKLKSEYPDIKLISRIDIQEIEPKIVQGRDSTELIAAIITYDTCGIINYQALAEAFIQTALKSDKDIAVRLNTKVLSINPSDYGYEVVTNNGVFQGRSISVTSGAHSIYFAHQMGYAKNLTVLPIGGDFFLSGKVVDSKVYTMQDPDLPFAAIHADPPYGNRDETRFGPTARLVLVLERRFLKSFFDFIKVLPKTSRGWLGLLRVITNRKRMLYMLKNLLYRVPILGKWFYLNTQVRKIIPSIKYGELRLGRGIGGLRPQVVNIETGELGHDIIEIIGNKIIFTITPSPGATACLQTAERNVKTRMSFLGQEYIFDQKRFDRELRTPRAVV